MKYRLTANSLRRALLRPEPLLAFLLLLVSLFYLGSGLRQETPAVPRVEIGEPDARPTTVEEVRLVRYDDAGLEMPTLEDVAMPADAAGRVSAILAALRSSLPEGQWPAGLPLPAAYAERLDGRQVVILDFRPEERLTLTVQDERRLLLSISETLAANGFGELRFLLGGQPAGVFLEHIAVPSGL